MSSQNDLNQALDAFVSEMTPRIRSNMCMAVIARMDFNAWIDITKRGAIIKEGIVESVEADRMCVEEMHKRIMPTGVFFKKDRISALITVPAHIDFYFAAAPDHETTKQILPHLETDDDPEIRELAAQYPLLSGQLARENERWKALRNGALSPANIVDYVQRFEAGLLKTE